MFDRETDSLWNQFTGESVSGPLVNSGIRLKIRPVTITSWAAWKNRHPTSRVLSLDKGFTRDYGSGVVYRDYFASPDLMFPAIVRNEETVKRKDYVFGIRDVASAKAWPVSVFSDGSVIIDSVGGKNVVLIGDAATRTAGAYERDDRTSSSAGRQDLVSGPSSEWSVSEDALTGQGGTTLARIAGHIS